MLLLEDHSLEIPPAFLRNRDGMFRYPKFPTPLIPEPVTAAVTQVAEIPRLTAHDLEVIEMLQRQGASMSEEDRAAKKLAAAERKAAERAEKAKKQEAVKKQKLAAFQHFKWSSLT